MGINTLKKKKRKYFLFFLFPYIHKLFSLEHAPEDYQAAEPQKYSGEYFCQKHGAL